MDRRSTSGNCVTAASRLALMVSISGLLYAGLGLGQPATALAQASASSCRSAGLAFWQAGDKRLEYYADQHGHDVEVWCTRGVLTSQYDLRIGWNEPGRTPVGADRPAPAVIHRSMTIGGCFFNDGSNAGPVIDRDRSGAFKTVEWTNVGPAGDPKTYHFSYDFRTGEDTITLTTPCGAAVSKVVAPQRSFARMEAVLPDPPATSCALTTQRPS